MPLFSFVALPPLKELVSVISMLKECCSTPEQLCSKQRRKSSTSRGIRGGHFGGSDERRTPWCKLQFGSQCGRGRRRYKASDGWRTVFGRAWEIQLEKFESKTKEIYDSVSRCVRSATKTDVDREKRWECTSFAFKRKAREEENQLNITTSEISKTSGRLFSW